MKGKKLLGGAMGLAPGPSDWLPTRAWLDVTRCCKPRAKIRAMQSLADGLTICEGVGRSSAGSPWFPQMVFPDSGDALATNLHEPASGQPLQGVLNRPP